MYWYNIISTKNTIPSQGRGAAAGEMAGMGDCNKIVQRRTPTSTFAREGIAHVPALYITSTKNTVPSQGRGAAAGEMAGRGDCSKIVQRRTPTSTFPREGIAHVPALYITSTKNTVPSHGRGAAASEMAGRGNCSKIVQRRTPTSTFLREGIAHVPALLLIVSLIVLLPGCKPDVITDATPHYFDIKGYFRADSARLAGLNRLTLKSVSHNGITESKKVRINNWGLELGLFSSSDINKPAWKDSYVIQGDSNTIIYRAKYPELKTRNIVIKKQNNKVKWIMISNQTRNILYQTTEKLSYFPDSIYIIDKSQQVKLLGRNRYTIKGSLN